MKKLLLLLFISLSLSVTAQQMSKLGIYQAHFFNQPENLEKKINVFVKGNTKEITKFVLEKRGVIKGSINGFLSINLKGKYVKDLSAKPYLTQLDLNYEKPMVMNDTMRVRNKINEIHNGNYPLINSYTGKDVIVGIIDGGLDFRHGDFQNADGSTRVLRTWKQYESFDAVRTPVKYGYGRVYDSTDVNDGTAYPGGQYLDHGCTVTGTAAGNAGENGRQMGVAPDANLVIVNSNFNASNWTQTVADGVDYICDIADSLNMPCVINASLGNYAGSHDGQDLAALYIDSVLAEKPGRIMVCAGGNSDTQAPYHLGYNVTSDTSFTWFTYNSSTAAGAGIYLEIWADSTEFVNIDWAMSADFVNVDPFVRIGRTEFFNETDFLNTIVSDTINNGTGTIATVQYYATRRGDQYHMEIFIGSPSNTYRYGLNTTGSGKFDLWSASWLGYNNMTENISGFSNPEMVYYVKPDTAKSIVSSWACSPNVITVANYMGRTNYIAYDSLPYSVPGTDGDKAPTSSLGPTRDERIKPDIAATGDMMMSAISLTSQPTFLANEPYKLDIGGMHVRNGGTSQASPVIAGIAALYLEKCPNATPQEFLNAITTTADADSFTGTLPNNAFGYGKVNGFNALISSNFTPLLFVDTILCEGEVTIANTGNYSNYVWMDSSINNQYIIDSTITLSYSAINTSGCIGYSDTIQVTSYPNPLQPNIVQNGDLLSTDSLSNLYQWVFNSGNIVGANTINYVADSSGYYQIEILNQYGCSNISDSIYVSITGIEEHEKIEIQIYPNPAQVVMNVMNNSEFNLQLKVVDLNGKTHGNYSLKSFSNVTIDVNKLSNGIYFVEYLVDEKKYTHKLIVSH